MTMVDSDRRESYAGDGATTVFSFPHKFLDEDALVVISRIRESGVATTLTKDTDYTVTGEGEAAGGSVTMSSAPEDTVDIVIYDDPVFEQELDLSENDTLPAESIEDEFDHQNSVSLRLRDRLDRAIQLDDSYVDDFDPTMPATFEAGDLIRINDTGDGIACDSADDIDLDIAHKGEFDLDDGVAVATDITDLTLDAALYSAGNYFVKVRRGSTVMGVLHFTLVRLNGAWIFNEGEFVGTGDHGLTLTVTETGGVAQIQYVSDSSGAGEFDWKGQRF